MTGQPDDYEVTRDGAEPWEGPTDDEIYLLLDEIRDGAGQFLILRRIADASGQTYVQTALNADGTWAVEKREGGPDRHYATLVTDLGAAHRIIAEWAFGTPNRDGEPAWERVEF